MSDTREALARLLMDWGCDDESAGRCAGEILAEFLVVPRSEVAIEMQSWGRWGMDEVAARQRETWTGPWSPIPPTEQEGDA